MKLLILASLFFTLAAHGAGQPRLLLLGSSSAEFWETFASDFPGYETRNRGKAGTTYDYVVEHARGEAADFAADVVLLYSGDNDVNRGDAPERVEENFRRSVEEIRKARPSARIFVISIKPSPSRAEKLPGVRAANERLEKEAGTLGVTYVDVFTPMLGPEGRPRPELFRADQLHLNAAGYALWAKMVQARLKTGR